MRATVLMYHQIGDNSANDWERHYFISPRRFSEHISALRDSQHRVVSLDSLEHWLTGMVDFDSDIIIITFDDGYQGVFDHGFPVLAANEFPFSVFLVSARIGGHDEWTGNERASQSFSKLLSDTHIREMAQAGVSFGSHSRWHTDLTRLAPENCLDDLMRSREELQKLLNQEVFSLAYPYGAYNEAVRDAAAKAGFRLAFSTRSGFHIRTDDRLAVRRLDVSGTDTASQLMRKIRYGTNDGSWRTSTSYYLNRARQVLGRR